MDPTQPLTIALLQLRPAGADQAANAAIGLAACRQARSMGADIALFPELWNVGYTFARPAPANPPAPGNCDLWRAPRFWPDHPADPITPEVAAAIGALQAQAIPRDAPFIRCFQELATELEMAIALGYLEQWPGAPRNTVSLIDRHGALALTYAKVHTCDFGLPEAMCTPGDDFYVCELDTAAGPLNVGAMICYDREFPESARILMLDGAEIILVPNACGLEINRLAQIRARAYENMLGIAVTNYAGAEYGHSIAFDGIACTREGTRDMLLVEAGDAEGIYLAHFDLSALREYRQSEIWGNAFRRPQKYGRLADRAVAEPFVRVDHRGVPYPRELR